MINFTGSHPRIPSCSELGPSLSMVDYDTFNSIHHVDEVEARWQR